MSRFSQQSSRSGVYHLLKDPQIGKAYEVDKLSRFPSTTTVDSALGNIQKDDSMISEDIWSDNQKNRKGNNFGGKMYRLEGGESKQHLPTCKYKPPLSLTTECTTKSRDITKTQSSTKVTVINFNLADIKPAQKNHTKSQKPRSRGKQEMSRTRGTQTLYRESSAQTLPHLAEVRNKKSELDELEIFKLPTILPGDGPPGLYEVEVLERARKRWAFMKALKENFKNQIQAQGQLRIQNKMVEVFEWEHWLEREEYIQHCQMLRLDIVIRMFEKREKEIHQSHQSRMEIFCSQVAAKRDAELRKNGREYGRQLRHIELAKSKQSRHWRKENTATLLGHPSSEFYLPQLRYGVHPNRRHYVTEKRAFDERIDEMERRGTNISLLLCPFAKLKKLSRPKADHTEVELNFCSDSNLQILYEQLTNLRKQASKQKTVPNCLKRKTPPDISREPEIEVTDFETEPSETKNPEEEEQRIIAENLIRENEAETFRHQVEQERSRSVLHRKEHCDEEIEVMLTEYEGSTIGWLMRFLSDEMNRLQEQQSLLYISMMAQKERWRREAAEAGLRQKENEMREIYEQIYQRSNEANIRLCSDYTEDVITVDTRDYAEQTATNAISDLAKIIDNDIQLWLQSIKSIQTPLNYQKLRYLLKDIIFPDSNRLAQRYESALVVEGIIADFLFPHLEELLEGYDICTRIGDEVVDRVMGNDIIWISDDSSDGPDVSLQEREAHGILRKLIRRAVPGRRWMTPSERIADTQISEILDELFERKRLEEKQLEKELDEEGAKLKIQTGYSHLDLIHGSSLSSQSDSGPDSDEELMMVIRSTIINQRSTVSIYDTNSEEKLPLEQFDKAAKPTLETEAPSENVAAIEITSLLPSIQSTYSGDNQIECIQQIIDDIIPFKKNANTKANPEMSSIASTIKSSLRSNHTESVGENEYFIDSFEYEDYSLNSAPTNLSLDENMFEQELINSEQDQFLDQEFEQTEQEEEN